MIRRFFELTLAGVLVGLLLAGCSTDTNLGGVKIPNARPDTRVAGQPPTLLEAGYAVEFHWTGSDPDGKVKGFQWKISDNGKDGISPRDTLTVDPLTGAILHPWHFTTATDSTFFVLADQEDFPGDPVADPRSFRSHSLFIRAVDDKDAIDPTPAYISFTATTLVPTCRVVFKGLSTTLRQAKIGPSTVNVGWEGLDPDSDLRAPTKVRFLWKKTSITNVYAYTQADPSLLPDFNDPSWSPWIPYKAQEEDRKVSFPHQEDGQAYFFAVQVQDTAGAVSVGLGYQKEVGNFKIIQRYYTPAVDVSEPFLPANSPLAEIAAGQPLNFSWTADASSYEGNIVSYRHGWDLTDIDNPADPGWAVPPGLSKQNLFAEERVFQEGLHTFYLRVVDDSGTTKDYEQNISVIPYVSLSDQKPLLIIDQVIDTHNQLWPDQSGNPRNAEIYRNAYWRFLDDVPGGVADMVWQRDWIDQSKPVHYSDLVKYKVVLCYARKSESQLMFSGFRTKPGLRDQFVWLTPYQLRGGNLFLVGQNSMDSFLEDKANYAVPIVFDTRETTMLVGTQELTTGFLPRRLPDGTYVERGPLQYPYATAGISTLDWTAPTDKYIYGRQVTVDFDRTVVCNGLKGLSLDPDFKAHLAIGPGVIPDTLWTNPVIDWVDARDAAADTIDLPTTRFGWGDDEFVDGNISPRTTPYQPQECDPSEVPEAVNGLCIEPMFRGIARLDWMRELKRRRGDVNWPFSEYQESDLDDLCGPLGTTDYQGQSRASARTNGQTFGYFSYKMSADKINKKADVYWGFDPYRFDAVGTQKAIRWVLTYFGLSINR